MLTDADRAARTQSAVDAAVGAARRLGYSPGTPEVLHDLFSVVVALDPEPVVVRVPTVLPPGHDPERQRAQQRREVAVCRWLATSGHPVVAPIFSDQPVAEGGFSMTFWTRVHTLPPPEPSPAAAGAGIAAIHTALRSCPLELNWMQPMDDTIPAMLDALRADPAYVSPDDRERAVREWDALAPVLGDRAGFVSRFPRAHLQPLHGDAPAHNVLTTPTGPVDSDFEHVSHGPVEWDLTFVGPEVVSAYEDAAGHAVEPEVLALCEAARLVQLVAWFAMVPQQPSLGEGMRPLLEQWRDSPPCGGVLDE
ncbi:phosphotransferase [Pseudonocardia sp. C8]|uniref:phosphotransferase family protein n=1 Tax=Pseudonocardia sp. C8 TaxID=2762759 RepID=UPI001642C967|nr:phosphotransferase [Pseudonocardia sp. C8]MBC3194531.1 phosphotransferase [Pseudonocardia sp. C8]